MLIINTESLRYVARGSPCFINLNKSSSVEEKKVGRSREFVVCHRTSQSDEKNDSQKRVNDNRETNEALLSNTSKYLPFVIHEVQLIPLCFARHAQRRCGWVEGHKKQRNIRAQQEEENFGCCEDAICAFLLLAHRTNPRELG